MGFLAIFRKKKIPHPDGVDAYYTPGIVFDGGAEHLAYRNDRPHPLLTPYGGFLVQKQLPLRSPQSVYQYNALPVSSILPGVVAGQTQFQPLLQQGQLPNTDNNAVLSNALFGGVQ